MLGSLKSRVLAGFFCRQLRSKFALDCSLGLDYLKQLTLFAESALMSRKAGNLAIMLWSASILAALAHGQEAKPRARDLGIPFEGSPGTWNAITDVQGVEVGQTTLISGDGKLQVGKGPIRTGVTAILPRGRDSTEPAFAGLFSLNGNGEMTGTHWIEESGYLEGPVMITNTHSVGVVRDAVIAYQVKEGTVGPSGMRWSLPVVAETWDGWLNDGNGFHVKPEHVFSAWSARAVGRVAEGNVGGGTGMICYEFKGGIGTSSRQLSQRGRTYTVGVLVQANHGLRSQL